MKKYRLIIVSLALFVIGVFSMYLSISTQVAGASSTINETWQATKYRTLTYNNKKISIGPSRWAINGSVDGTSYSEEYVGSGWKSTNCPGCNYSDEDFTSLEVSYPEGASSMTLRTTGLYGFLAYGTYTEPNLGATTYSTGPYGTSYPTSWTVTGALN